MFGITNDPKPAVEGHVFPNPTDDRKGSFSFLDFSLLHLAARLLHGDAVL